MRLREAGVVMVLCLALNGAGAAVPPAMSASAVQAAASAVAADPLMAGQGKTLRLRLKRDDHGHEKPADRDRLRWWAELIGSLSAGLRVAVWLGLAVLLVWVLLRLRDWLQRSAGGGPLTALPPTHVGTLDIRPDSLPADIGQAARALMARGEERAALSLLYRGALSRLVHGHGVPVRAASTERECLALSAARLPPAAHAFLAQLVGTWQAVAYAQRRPAPADVEALCHGFDAQLPAAPGVRA